MILPRLLRPPPQTQACSSTTFRPPPINGSLTLPELFDWHLEHTPNHRLFIYSDDEGGVRTIYWPEAVRAIHVGAKIIRDRMQWKPASGMSDETSVVAILAASDTIPYFATTMSIMRANYIAFPISPRNSATAVAYLLSKVGVRHILVGHDQAMRDLANDALDILGKQYPSTPQPELSPVPLFEDLFLPNCEATVHNGDLPFEYKGPDATVIILHSSGSTAFPKPIMWTNHRFAQLALIPWFGERDLTDQTFSLHTMPMYHGMGILQLCWTASCGLVVSAFQPKSPTPVPTPDGLFKAAKATNSDIIFCVPSFIEAWSRNPEYVKWLSTRGGVLYGGGPLNKEAGDLMASQGVSIFILYGSTEGGIMSPILPAQVRYDWDYFRFPDLVTSKMIPYGDNTFEFVMVSNEVCRPSVLNTKVDGIDAYATSDLLAPHPNKSGYWRVFGRTDDQIMHNTGEKTNPGPLENMLNQDPHILASVMFGRGRFQAGVLVDPRPRFKFDPGNEVELAEFRNKIWPTVERTNAYAPQHSRLFKEMIIVAKPSKPFTYTAKNTVRRQAVINDYDDEINTLYEIVDKSTQTSIPPPVEWDMISTTDFVRAVVNKVMVHTVRDEDDFFQHGCDSLQATWIRNSILRGLRDSAQLDTRKAAENIVYEHPSIARLASFIFTLASGIAGDSDTSHAARADTMRAMAVQYSRDFPMHQPGSMSMQNSSEHSVLVTGTTGALGSHVLAQLISDQEVSRVYALNRISKHGRSLHERQDAALADRGLDPGIMCSRKIVLLEGDLSVPGFGVSDADFQEMQQCVTHIIHTAWLVDFNLALTSFESNIKGLRNLIDFALHSPLPDPPRLIYTSSIGVFQNIHAQHSEPLLEGLITAEVAAGTGYAESKWVSERILAEAAAQTSLKPLAVRVGQLSGGLNGAWNPNEWVPSLVQSAGIVGCIPNENKEVSWIPLHTASAALVDFCNAPQSTTIILHLIHPRAVSWSSLAAVISSELSVPLLPYADWLAKLEQAAVSVSRSGFQDKTKAEMDLLVRLRAIRLLPFFKGLGAKAYNGNAMGFPQLSAAQAKAASSTLADPRLPQVGSDDVKRWLAYWRKVGLLSAT